MARRKVSEEGARAIRALYAEHGWSVEEIRLRTGLSRGTVERYAWPLSEDPFGRGPRRVMRLPLGDPSSGRRP